MTLCLLRYRNKTKPSSSSSSSSSICVASFSLASISSSDSLSCSMESGCSRRCRCFRKIEAWISLRQACNAEKGVSEWPPSIQQLLLFQSAFGTQFDFASLLVLWKSYPPKDPLHHPQYLHVSPSLPQEHQEVVPHHAP
ncbi:Os03g0800050 [Oryza sativa Japonica Group]|uniref:Os03g0800050 protein n=1 Tax=Oryza sativa subsp. japonica TaxID=39947 RepID=A0A0P0W4A0_ORYSJ|nr:hypothetical protein EE612_021055 [Oryza sativa]BAS86884.1 Os03g0800050 [Oryza sativa Japonica Group]